MLTHDVSQMAAFVSFLILVPLKLYATTTIFFICIAINPTKVSNKFCHEIIGVNWDCHHFLVDSHDPDDQGQYLVLVPHLFDRYPVRLPHIFAACLLAGISPRIITA